jgi:hypothetical protein
MATTKKSTNRTKKSLQSSLNKTEVAPLVLRQLTDRYLPMYELDGGPLTEDQIAAIRTSSLATAFPEERVTRKLN